MNTLISSNHFILVRVVVDPGLVKGTPSMMWTDGTPVHYKNPYIHTFSLILLTLAYTYNSSSVSYMDIKRIPKLYYKALGI